MRIRTKQSRRWVAGLVAGAYVLWWGIAALLDEYNGTNFVEKTEDLPNPNWSPAANIVSQLGGLLLFGALLVILDKKIYQCQIKRRGITDDVSKPFNTFFTSYDSASENPRSPRRENRKWWCWSASKGKERSSTVSAPIPEQSLEGLTLQETIWLAELSEIYTNLAAVLFEKTPADIESIVKEFLDLYPNINRSFSSTTKESKTPGEKFNAKQIMKAYFELIQYELCCLLTTHGRRETKKNPVMLEKPQVVFTKLKLIGMEENNAENSNSVTIQIELNTTQIETLKTICKKMQSAIKKNKAPKETTACWAFLNKDDENQKKDDSENNNAIKAMDWDGLFSRNNVPSSCVLI